MRINLYHPYQNEMTIFELKNFEFLPLFYLFPIDLLRKECPSLADMPRSAHGIFTQMEWIDKVSSDYFLQAVCDLTAYFVWPAFGISTYMECFSGYDPIWKLAHATGIWEQAFEQMSGMTPQNLVNAVKQEWEPAEPDEFQELMVNIGLHGIQEHNLLPLIQEQYSRPYRSILKAKKVKESSRNGKRKRIIIWLERRKHLSRSNKGGRADSSVFPPFFGRKWGRLFIAI